MRASWWSCPPHSCLAGVAQASAFRGRACASQHRPLPFSRCSRKEPSQLVQTCSRRQISAFSKLFTAMQWNAGEDLGHEGVPALCTHKPPKPTSDVLHSFVPQKVAFCWPLWNSGLSFSTSCSWKLQRLEHEALLIKEFPAVPKA